MISAQWCQAPGVVTPDTGGLPAALAHLPDPRARRGVRHRLPVVVSAAVCAVVAGNHRVAVAAQRVDVSHGGGYRSYTRDCRAGDAGGVVDGPWVDDLPAVTVIALVYRS
ncbi:transposase family protein [Micromonospora sp. DT178]|uniref:transposase family protein n=1 Tax=Micromonospora sp. DT178 TaxID=3393436 RepID=UPI003CEFE710